MSLWILLGGLVLGGLALSKGKQHSAPSGGISYAPDASRPYGSKWRTRRPPGLPADARKASQPGAAYATVRQEAGRYGLGSQFVDTVLAIAHAESRGTFGLPAENFEVRCREGYTLDSQRLCTTTGGRRQGGSVVSAWGLFSFNRDAWRALAEGYLGLPPVDPKIATQWPWEATVEQEVRYPIKRYADLYRAVLQAGGTDLDAARGLRIWHKYPYGSHGFSTYLATGRQRGFDVAWNSMPPHLRDAITGVITQRVYA